MYEYSAIIKRVIDGDTLVVDLDMGRGIWVIEAKHRLVGCNAREMSLPGGPEAKQNLVNLLPAGMKVKLRSFKPYKYGGSSEVAEYMCDLFEVLGLPVGDTLVTYLIDQQWAAPWDGRGAAPLAPWPRTVTP